MEDAKELLFRWGILIFSIIEIKTKKILKYLLTHLTITIIEPLKSNINNIVLREVYFPKTLTRRIESFSIFTNLFNVGL